MQNIQLGLCHDVHPSLLRFEDLHMEFAAAVGCPSGKMGDNFLQASGAVFGLIGAYAGAAVIDRKKTNRRANPWLMIVFSVFTFVQSIGTGVNSWAHLGGMLTGFILGMVLRDNDQNEGPDLFQKTI